MGYRARRYMAHLNDDEIKQRARDIFLNLLVLTREAKIGLPPIDAEGQKWMILWTHVLEEFVLRFGPHPAGFTDGFIRETEIPNPRSPLASWAAEAVKSFDIPSEGVLVKYGKKRHLLPMYESGVIRVAPAAVYDDPSLHPSIRDNELELAIHPNPAEMRMEVFDQETGESKGALPPTTGKITTTLDTNYYVYCLSSTLVPRLFLDFDQADCCVIVRKPDEFMARIYQELERSLPGYTIASRTVGYIDPLNSTLNDIVLMFSKHFRYSYQKEYRVIAAPPSSVMELEPIFLELGSLGDLATILSV